jgi:protein phosphatase
VSKGTPDRTCPRCGHINTANALYCFQCGRDLAEQATVVGTPGTGPLVAGAFRFVEERGYSIGPELTARLKETRTKMPPENVIGEPLTCLRCGAFNQTDTAYCVRCGAPLAIPDDDFNLITRISARTSVGQVRTNNEDSVGLWAIDGVVLALIADGMGGAAAGEIASHLVAEAVQADFLGEQRDSLELHTLSEQDLDRRLSTAVLDANQAVIERARRDPTLKGMGTTATLALIRANRVLVAHVGDSRAYHIDGREGTISQITKDHSYVQALVASGHITAEQARSHPMGNILYRALGQSTDLEVDTYTRYAYAGDRIVMCSDGLTRHIDAHEIAETVMSDLNPHVGTQLLIELANQRGGEDNISVIVARLAESSSEETLAHRPTG